MKDGILTRQGATKLATGMVRNGLNTYLIMVLLVQIPYYAHALIDYGSDSLLELYLGEPLFSSFTFL